MKVTSVERRVTSEEERGGGGAGEQGGEEEARRVSLLAAVLFFLGLGAGCGAVVMGVLFFWPWLEGGARWVGWVIGNHPGLVMIGLMGVAVGALRLARWLDERGQ